MPAKGHIREAFQSYVENTHTEGEGSPITVEELVGKLWDRAEAWDTAELWE
jgi:hypothetical protein